MKNKWTLQTFFISILILLSGCEPVKVLDPKGPQAQIQAKDIMLSIWIMSFIVLVVFLILGYMLFKYRSSKQSNDYEPPKIKGSVMVEMICVGIPVLIIIFLSIVSVQSNNKVESAPTGYANKKPLIIYATSSNWKWHFSYPEENIETVNYLYIPTNRPLEFKLYSDGPITSFWIPQLGGQKYAMSDMVNTLYLAADVPGEYMGRNANFSGKGFAENTFNVEAVPVNKFNQWVKDVKKTASPLTKEKFTQLLKPGHLGELTFTGTHLEYLPPNEGGHKHHSSENDMDSEMEMNSKHSGH
ncbi:cytochrome aa3 quinol oxidase subunit II [Gottfriedia sp. NPDC057948]|uniref:cytochrome aa3 quinol oxidase subunit II n=1 Tax=Gottfriedia sp. NPDC057948 TaxID=3346287 RepID=UPI0036DA205D